MMILLDIFINEELKLIGLNCYANLKTSYPVEGSSWQPCIYYINLMGCPGFEPGTNRLKAEYSTVELATRTYARVCLDIEP
jgi:hypothetical protein